MVYGTVWSRRARTRDDGTAAEETSEETGYGHNFRFLPHEDGRDKFGVPSGGMLRGAEGIHSVVTVCGGAMSICVTNVSDSSSIWRPFGG
jgi:hypothetical protein